MIDKNGNLVYGSYGSLMSIGVDGSIPVTGGNIKAVTSPALPYWRSLQGNGYMTPIPGTNKVYFSGLYGPDTGFYRDGNVYKLDISTGVAEKWLTLPWDSIPKVKSPREIRLGGGPFFSAIHGTALDSAGRVYVCDRLNQQIGIYDSNAVLLRSIPLPCADQVAISKSGTIYAITRYQVPQNPFSSAGHVRLFKFTSFAEGTVKVCSLTLANYVHSQNCLSMTCLAVNDVNTKPWVWIGSSGITVRAYQDDGSTLTLMKDFFTERGSSNVVYDRLLVDRKTENVYVNDSWNGFYKIVNWSNPALLQCSTSARKPLLGADWAIGNNNLLYVREGVDYMGPVKRYTLDHLHSPANWANTNSNMLTSDIFNRFAPCTGDRGIALTTDNKVAVMQKNRTTAEYEVCVYGDSGSAVSTAKKVQISKLPQSCGGVQIDTKNNLYVGAVIRSSEFQMPPFYQGDKGYATGVGSIVKFAEGDTGSVGATSAVNASKVYSVPLGPFSADPYPASAPCVCRSPRFEVDAYGRIFAPNAVTNQVTIVDNEGNQLLQFGKYGNLDSRGVLPADLPSQQIITGTEIPLGWPTTVATSEDYIYVGDLVNCRLVRLKMSYALDNYPGLTEHVALEQNEANYSASSYRLTSGPVPFNQNSAIMLSLPSSINARIDVIDVRGKLVKTLYNGDLSSGVHKYSWNGTNLRNQLVSAGLYIYRVTAG
ncbi:MAG: hypothetical protein JNL74_12250, partial [Fibrobacteres bacterium]|nr:hypothetical protein [Fibrobacterota bacterium]